MSPPPDWQKLAGGSALEPWDEDRLRKFGRIRAEAEALLQLADAIAGAGATSECTPALLTRIPAAANWFVQLAGFSQKTLSNVGDQAAKHGLVVSPTTFLRNMRADPGRVSASDRAAFCKWVNAEIKRLFGDQMPADPRLLALHVAMITGGRIIGQGQNEGGVAAVTMLKRAILAQVDGFAAWSVPSNAGAAVLEEATLLDAPIWIHRATGAVLDFRAGGNRPDLSIYPADDPDAPTLVSEIKGRKDLSNTWESWMPQLADHLRTWAKDWPKAARGVFMTVITDEMVKGASRKGVSRTGLKGLNAGGFLDYAFNLTHLASHKEPQFREAIVTALKRARRR